VNDDVPRAAPGTGPNDIQPSIGVNNQGVVGVSWYDRRENTDDLGWRTRFAASYDGGLTFSASVPVSDAIYDPAQNHVPPPSDPTKIPFSQRFFTNNGGDVNQMTVDANGTFHVFWTDTRTGIAQIFTSTIRVSASGGSDPTIAPNGVLNAASFLSSLSPGAIMTIFGSGLSQGTSSASQTPLPTTLSGVSVSVNGTAAPLYYTSPVQINAQIPFETGAGSATVTVAVNGRTTSQAIQLSNASPGVFTDGARIVPIGSARRGDLITLFITGQGPLSPPVPTGATPAVTAGAAVPSPALNVALTVGNVPADILFVGVPAWSVGVTQINFRVPSSVAAGDAQVVVTVGGQPSAPAMLTILN